jgi:hypothetical protein
MFVSQCFPAFWWPPTHVVLSVFTSRPAPLLASVRPPALKNNLFPCYSHHEPASPHLMQPCCWFRCAGKLISETLGSWVRIPLKAWISVYVYSLFVLSCVQVAALRRADLPSKESYRLCKRRLRNWRRRQGQTRGCKANEWMNEWMKLMKRPLKIQREKMWQFPLLATSPAGNLPLAHCSTSHPLRATLKSQYHWTCMAWS